MKRIIYFALCAASAACFASCQTFEEQETSSLYLTAVMDGETETRTSLSAPQDGKSSVLWSAMDKIGVYTDGGTEPSTFTLVSGAGTRQASFSGEGFGSSYLAIYPSDLASSRSGNTLQITLPAEQSYREGGFAESTYPMVAVSASHVLHFKNLCSIVKIPILGEQTVSRIVFRANDPAVKLTGSASVDVSNADNPVLVMSESACDSLVLNTGGIQLDPVTPTYFHLVVPAQTYTGGFTVRIYTDGGYMDKALNADFTTQRSRMHNAGVVSFAPEMEASNYLTFTSEGTTTISMVNVGGNEPVLYYSTDAQNWSQWDYSGLTFTSGSPLYICGDNPEGFSKSYHKYSNFASSGDTFEVSGSIMSLLDRNQDISVIPAAYCFYSLFNVCAGLTAAPELPATTLADRCYSGMFLVCISLTAAPELPATTLATGCYSDMFNGCTSLTAAPELPATTLADDCYLGMFWECTSLTAAPELPATTLAQSCYFGMFLCCTSLTAAPELPATTLAGSCYNVMFQGCTSLTAAPELPATTLAQSCYYYMFNGCTSLTAAPELPATTLAESCYYYMFNGCTSLTAAPELPATTLATGCYSYMFNGCTSLTAAPELPATTLAGACYSGMFQGCTSLTAAPALPATTLAGGCYRRMFYYCNSLNYVKCLATDISATDCTYAWLDGVSGSGTFVKAKGVDWPSGPSGIPNGWTVQTEGPLSASNYLTFSSEGTTTVSLVNENGNAPLLYYSTDAQYWKQWDYSALTFTNGSPLYICGDNPEGFSHDSETFSLFESSGDLFSVSGSVMSLLSYDQDLTVIPSNYCFYGLFAGCPKLTAAPELPATTLTEGCYSQMFECCEKLTTAPTLPATTLAPSCYSGMFHECSLLTVAPELPATTLADNCYKEMFFLCGHLNAAPELPATTLTDRCYSSMFVGCSNLNYIKCLATDISATDCTYAWLDGVSGSGTFVKAAGLDWPTGEDGIPEGWTVQIAGFSASKYLTFTSEGSTTISMVNEGGNAPVLYYSTDAQNWTQWDYSALSFTSNAPLYICGDNPERFSVSESKYSHFSSSGDNFEVSGSIMSLLNRNQDIYVIPSADCFSYLFSNCTGLTSAPNLPATTITSSCYSNMFENCSGLTTAPALPATTLASHCYYSMFEGCTNLTSAPALPATTMENFCYCFMFRDCTSLATAPELPAMNLANCCYDEMFNGCSSLTSAPELPATTLAEGCYFFMFGECSNLSYVKCLATDISAEECTLMWLYGVSGTGTFVKAHGVNWPSGTSGIPTGWTVQDYKDAPGGDNEGWGEEDWN